MKAYIEVEVPDSTLPLSEIQPAVEASIASGEWAMVRTLPSVERPKVRIDTSEADLPEALKGRSRDSFGFLPTTPPPPPKKEPMLKWCNSCGEGVVGFCRGRGTSCPMGLTPLRTPTMQLVKVDVTSTRQVGVTYHNTEAMSKEIVIIADSEQDQMHLYVNGACVHSNTGVVRALVPSGASHCVHSSGFAIKSWREYYAAPVLPEPKEDFKEVPQLGDGFLWCAECRSVQQSEDHTTPFDRSVWCKGTASWIQGPFYTKT